MKEFRDKAYAITGDPHKFPPHEAGGTRYNISKLTKNIGTLLFSEQTLMMKPYTAQIFLQISHAEAETQQQNIESRSISVRKWKLMAIDGDGN